MLENLQNYGSYTELVKTGHIRVNASQFSIHNWSDHYNAILNIMKDLEEEGYLYQPHTSGGRIPTDKAYRYYVDYLTGIQRMAAQERQRIEQQYDERVGELNNIMLHTSRLLARLSGAAGFVYAVNV